MPVPSLDTWTSLFLLAAGQGLFLTVLLFQQSRKKNFSGIWLAGLILAFSGLLIFNVCYWTHYNWYYPPVNLLYPTLAFLIAPFLLFYLDGLAVKPVFRSWRVLHFLPAALVFFLRLPAYFGPLPNLQDQMQAGQDVTTLLHQLNLEWLLSAPFITGYLILYAGLVFWYGHKIIDQRSRQVEMNGHRPLLRRWIVLLTALFVLYSVSFISYYILVRMSFFRIEHDYLISLVMAASIYIIGYREYRRPGLVNRQWSDSPSGIKYSTSSLTPGAQASIAGKLKKHMEDARPYRDNELRLSDLAEDLGVSVHHLSQVINESYHKTFNQYINEYRVREAMLLLASDEYRESYIIEIAYQVGFNNKTTFNQAFKAVTGMSPSKWRSELPIS